MKNQFIPFELALKLKELGFDEECFRVKLKNSPEHWYTQTDYEDYPEQKSKEVLIPLWQQAEDFLLKKYNLYGVIIPTVTMHWTFKTMTVVEGVVEVPPYNHVDADDYSTIEEARQACLEKLIELCEKN